MLINLLIQRDVTRNKILLYSFSVKLFSVLCAHWGLMPINIGTDKHNVLSQHILNGDEVKGHVSSRQLLMPGKAAQMNRNNLVQKKLHLIGEISVRMVTHSVQKTTVFLEFKRVRQNLPVFEILV